MRKKKIIIIGSGSFIGSELIKNFRLNKIDFIPINRKKIDLIKKSSVLKLKNLIKDNDSVIFISALAPVKNIYMFQDNMKMAENFMSAMQNKKLKYFLYVSSDAVYSDSKYLIKEKSSTKPDNLHGLMHLMRENTFKFLNAKKCFVRPTLVYGEEDPHNGYGPNQFIRLAQSKKNIRMFGKGEERRDHIYIGDVGKIIFELFNRNVVGIINLVTGKLYTFYTIANNVSKIYKVKIKKIKRVGPMPHGGYRAFNNDMLKKILPNYKFTDLSQFIRSKVKYKI